MKLILGLVFQVGGLGVHGTRVLSHKWTRDTIQRFMAVLEHPILDSPFRLDNEQTRKALDSPRYPKSEKRSTRSPNSFS
jgi:hypothetical protein